MLSFHPMLPLTSLPSSSRRRGALAFLGRVITLVPAWIPFSLLVSAILLNQHRVPGDDEVIATLLNDMSLCDFIVSRYRTWSGRVPINILLVIFLRDNFVFFLKIIYSIAAAGIFYTTSFIFNRDRQSSVTCYLALFGFLCIPKWVIWDSCLWLTGAANYLLPFSCLFFASLLLLLKLKNETPPHIFAPICLCCLSFAVFSEQIFVLSLWLEIVLLILFFRCHIRPPKVFWAYCLLTLGFGLTGVLAPGNFVRTVKEVQHWYPTFYQVPLGKRIFDTVHLLFVNLFRDNAYFACLFSFPIFLSLLACGKRNRKSASFFWPLSSCCFQFCAYLEL